MMHHLAIIMDGNRRWAKQRGLFAWDGHKHGVESIKRALSFCLKNNIPYLSLYTFSLENFKRSEQERSYLFNILANEVVKQLDHFIQYNIRVRFIGDRSLFPQEVRPAIEQVEEYTRHCKALNVQFLFCYGARQEIVASVKHIVQKVKAGLVSEDEISDELIHEHLWTCGIPEPDLIVRTGGAQRTSNFLLYQGAYSELYFLSCFWPDVTDEHLSQACDYFVQCKRNYGS